MTTLDVLLVVALGFGVSTFGFVMGAMLVIRGRGKR